ncbi:unnamed protein product [Urochloa humidicola]
MASQAHRPSPSHVESDIRSSLADKHIRLRQPRGRQPENISTVVIDDPASNPTVGEINSLPFAKEEKVRINNKPPNSADEEVKPKIIDSILRSITMEGKTNPRTSTNTNIEKL